MGGQDSLYYLCVIYIVSIVSVVSIISVCVSVGGVIVLWVFIFLTYKRLIDRHPR